MKYNKKKLKFITTCRAVHFYIGWQLIITKWSLHVVIGPQVSTEYLHMHLIHEIVQFP